MSSVCNKQDAKAFISTKKQVRGSIQTQDKGTSPFPTLTVIPQDRQGAIALQLKGKQWWGELIKWLSVSIAVVLMAVGTVVWVLSITDAIQGPWSSICPALFTSFGTIITLLQLYFQFMAVPTPAVAATPWTSGAQSSDPLDEAFSIPRPGGQEGVLVVYTKRSLRGFSVALCCGFWEDTGPYAAQNIVERKIRGHVYHIAVFESLPPGPYTAHIYRREMTAEVTIYPGKVTAVDWR